MPPRRRPGALHGATRKAGKQQKQAPALTDAALAQIRATAYAEGPRMSKSVTHVARYICNP